MIRGKRYLVLMLVALAWLNASLAIGAEENPIHEQLRTLKKNAEAAFNKNDIDGLLKYVDKDIVATWQDGRVTRGHDGIREYYDKMLGGKQSVVSKVSSDITVDELSKLYSDDTAIAEGTMAQHFELRDGMVFDLTSRWTATVVKRDDQWKIASFHVSADIFDNPILAQAERKTATWAGIGAGLVGLLVGLLVGRTMGKPKAP